MVQTYVQRENVAESLGWAVNDISDCCTSKLGIECCQYSPAGEDFFFVAQADNIRDIIHEIVEYARDFDPDEHVRGVMDMSGAPSLRVLIEDAYAIADMISELADAMISYKEDDDGVNQI